MSKTAKAVAAIVVTVAAIVTLNPTLIKAAVALDSAVIADALAPKPPAISSGSESRWKADPRAGVPYAVGRCAIAGDIRFEKSAPVTGGNKYKNFVTVYSVGPIQGFEGFYANNNLVPFTADGGEGASGYYLNRMWLRTQLGGAHEPYLHWSATGSKDTPANHGGLPTSWTPAHKLSGYAASLWGMEWDTARFAGGVPPPKMVGSWVKIYDPRKDSTYPGGVGPHRYASPANKAAYLAAQATWEWSANPYLHGLMWALGRWTGDPDRLDEPLIQTHGFGLDIEDIDVAAFVDGANVATANSWTIGGQVSSIDDKWEVEKAFLQAGAGEPILLGDKLSCLVNTPKVSLATLSGRDAVGEVSLDAAVPYNERLNTVWPSWTVEDLAWELTPAAAPVQVAEYLSIDKGERSKELSLPLVQRAVQAGQLSRYLIEDSRELTNIVIPARPEWMWLEPGDCFTANEPAWGLNGQKLLIRQRVRDPATMVVTLVCRTETDGKHPFALGQTATPPNTPALTGVDPNVVPLPSGDAWTVVGGVVAGESGSLPAIVIAGEADLYDAVTIVVDYREIEPEIGEWRSASFPASARTLVVQGLKPGARYQVRVRYITARGVENPDANTDLGEIIVGGVDAGTLAGRPAQEVVDDLATSGEELARNILLQENFQAYQEELNYTGDGVATKLVAVDAITKAATAIQRLALLAAVTPDGLGMVLNAATAIADSTHTLASLAAIVTSTLGDGTITVSQIMEAIDGQKGRIALAVNGNGQVVGLDFGIDGPTSHFDIVSPNLRVIDPTGAGGPLVVLAYNSVAARWEMSGDLYVKKLVADSVETANIKAQNVVVPLTSTGASTISCDGTAKQIISHTVTLAYGASVISNCVLSSHFPGGNKAWLAELFINGVSVFDCGGANGEATMSLAGGLYCAAGSVLVEVRLTSDPTVNVTSRTLTSIGPMR